MIQENFLIYKKHKIETFITLYFEGIKEETSLKNYSIYLWIQEDNGFDFWLKITPQQRKLFYNYLKNKEKLLKLIKNSKLTLFKRHFEKYEELEYLKVISYQELENMNFFLPNEKATLGYDFFNLIF
jgi:hypothetical protein